MSEPTPIKMKLRDFVPSRLATGEISSPVFLREFRAICSMAPTPFTASECFSLANLVEFLDVQIVAFQKAHFDAVKKYGKPLENQKDIFQVRVEDGETFQKFQAEMDELLDREVTLPLAKRIHCPQGLTPFQVRALMPILGSPE